MPSFKVALISEEFPPFAFGGVASVCHDLAYALSKRGVSTTVLCGRAKRLEVERVNNYLKVIRLPCFDSPPRFLWFQLQNLKLFQRIFRNFSVLHIVNPEAGASTAYLGKKFGIPVVTSIHGTYLYPLKKIISSPFSAWNFGDIGFKFLGYPLHTSLFNSCLRASSRIAVCNFGTVAELERLFPYLDLAKVTVIPNAIDFEGMDSITPTEPVRRHSIIFYGRLFWIKGVGLLIEAVANLKEDFPDIQLRIFGEGPYRSKIDQLVSNFGLTENVEIRRFAPHKELWKRIKETEVVVAPSMAEAQSVAVLEGMALRKPVVAFDYPFSQEVIRHMHNGLLAEKKNVKDLAEKIRLLFSDEKLSAQIAENGYESVKRKHNWDTLIDQYLKMYEDAREFSSLHA